MMDSRAFPLDSGRSWLVGFVEAALLLAAFLISFAPPAEALPSFVRKEGDHRFRRKSCCAPLLIQVSAAQVGSGHH